MDSDPRALSDMFAPVFQKSIGQSQSYLMDSDTTTNGRTKGAAASSSRSKTNGRSRSATTSDTPSATIHEHSPTISRTVSTPSTPTSPKPPAKPKRGLFSLLASAASQPPPTPPKSTEPAQPSTPESNVKPDTSSPLPQQVQSSPSFMASIARRLSGSSGSKKPVSEPKPSTPQCVRRTLNVNHVRPRPEIKELEKIQLRRVCFVVDETLISRRVFKATDPFEIELPREQKLKLRDLKEAYYRSARHREVTPDDKVAKAFATCKGVELKKLVLSGIKFANRDAVLPVCDVLSLARGLDEVVLDNCALTDEQLRLFLAALLSIRQSGESETEWCRGIARLSIAGNKSFGPWGWRFLASFVHMNADLIALNISNIPISIDTAKLLARAIALPNPCRREVPPEFRLQPISPKPKSQRRFSLRRNSSGSSELTRTSSPLSKRQSEPTLSEEIEAIPEPHDPDPDKSTSELPEITPQSPLSSTFANVSSRDSSSVVIVDAPAEIAPETPPPKVRRKVEELNMNNCCVTAEILEQFLPAVTHGGVRYWDIGRNDFGPEGMEMLAGLFAEPKVEVKVEVDQSQEPARPSTPVSSISSTAMSTASIPPESSASPSGQSKLEYVSLEGTDLSARQLDPLLNAWLLHPPQYLSLFALDLPNCSLGQDLDVVANLFTALERFPNFRFLGLAENPLFSNANGMLKLLRESLPRLTLLRRIDLNSTGLEAPHLVELSSILPSLKLIAAIHLLNNPIYAVTNVEDQSEGQTEDVSGLTALEAAMRYCRHLIEVELPDGGGVEAARLRHKIFLRCFKNIEVLDSIAHPNAQEDLSESGLGGRKRTTTEEAKELVALQPQKEGRDKYEVDRGYGIARALETVLLNPQGDKAQDMSLDLLHRARKIKERLQPALVKKNQDAHTFRRLNFLNMVLTKVIDRFEEAYPEQCRHAVPKPKEDHEPESSDEEDFAEEEQVDASSPPSPTQMRRSSSMTEIARGLELEEGDVHRFGSLIKSRNIVHSEPDLSGEQLLEAILKVDKDTVEREVWDHHGLQRVLRKSIDIGSQDREKIKGETSSEPVREKAMENGGTSSFSELAKVSSRDKKDSDSHSI